MTARRRNKLKQNEWITSGPDKQNKHAVVKTGQSDGKQSVNNKNGALAKRPA